MNDLKNTYTDAEWMTMTDAEREAARQAASRPATLNERVNAELRRNEARRPSRRELDPLPPEANPNFRMSRLGNWHDQRTGRGSDAYDRENDIAESIRREDERFRLSQQGRRYW